MSPSSREINGPRPSPLKIHKDSHQIQKQSSSSSTTAPTPTSGGAHQQQRHQPIIIYTHSPKVIHTQARDFMALVQKLTGLSRSPNAGDNEDKMPDPEPASSKALGRAQDTPPHPPPPPPPPSTAVDPTAELGFLSEIPLFTPSSGDHYFCSPKSLYRFAEAKSFPEF